MGDSRFSDARGVCVGLTQYSTKAHIARQGASQTWLQIITNSCLVGRVEKEPRLGETGRVFFSEEGEGG